MGGKEKKSCVVYLCPMGNLASYIKDVVAVPPQYIIYNSNLYISEIY